MIQVIYSRWIPTLIGALGFLPRKAAAQAESASETPWFFSPVAEPAGAILDFGLLITLICAGIFFTVSTALVYTLIRYRERPGDEGHEPAQVYGSEQLELAWTITPVLIVIVLSLITAGRIFVLQKDEPPPNSLSIRVVGHQWVVGIPVQRLRLHHSQRTPPSRQQNGLP